MLKIVTAVAAIALSVPAPLAQGTYRPDAPGVEAEMQVLDDPGTAADESGGEDSYNSNASAPLSASVFGDKGKDWIKGDSDSLAAGTFSSRR